ncbi:hypothetical protein N7462_008092 [Penicillium macrosclerotiorum]|uniref:uncharacterized protein n=1 Tax=Penicillium macrosclerotiorum TaxID=303699 RepID=UPI0025470B44|nr:uncharacterized protein N7462_008092 [Penicillium macrosclerotiorum]KAJ5679848.1 hypothetical protein N7462_008092 [Penicillium macrosclerotiorum]
MEYTDDDAIEPDKSVLPVEDDTARLLENKDEDDLPTLRQSASHPFKKWMDSFRARKRVPPTIPERYVEGWSDSSQTEFSAQQSAPRRDSLLSGYSSQLGTVKTATVSIASQSMARSRGRTQSTAGQSTLSDARASGDSSRPTSSNNCVDEQAELRANRRRLVLREIVMTETDYVLGLKALTGVLSIFNTRPQIYHNIQRIREIHERFLTQLQTISPMSASQSPEGASDLLSRGVSKLDLPGLKGLQNRSLRTRNFKATINQRLQAFAAEPVEALEVAREIDKLSLLFSSYEEFCRNYDLFAQDMALLRRSIPNWAMFDQGIEALSKSVASMESRKNEYNKSMTMSDLMIKVRP